MKKKFFLKFFLFTVIATLVTFTSCKDYDDDISRLDNEIANLSGVKTDLTAVKADIAAAQASAAAAQTAANDALAKANDALQAAQNAGDADAIAAAQTAADNAQAAADAAQAKADEVEAEAERLLGLIEALEGRVDALEALDSPSKQDLEDLKDEVALIQEDASELTGKMVTGVYLLDTEVKFSTITEKENVFVTGLPGAITFTKDKQLQSGDSFIIQVSPSNAKVTKDMITLLNGNGDVYDNIVVTAVEPYKELFTRATANTGLWKVSVELKGYNQTSFDAATKSGANKILFAVSVGDGERDVRSLFDLELTYSGPFTPADELFFFVGDKHVKDVNNRFANNSVSLENPGTGTPLYAEKTWSGTPATAASGTNTVADASDNRSLMPVYPAIQGKPIKIALTEALADAQATAPGNIRGMYVSLDLEANAIESAPSEWAAWKSYSYTGLDKVVEGTETEITINSQGAIKDMIGFRVYAVNKDGTLVDPDGKAFYVSLGKDAVNWNAVNTVITATQEVPNTVLATQSTLADVTTTALSGATTMEWTTYGANGAPDATPAFQAYFVETNGTTAVFNTSALGTIPADFTKAKKVYTMPTVNDWLAYKDNHVYKGTLTIKNATGHILATIDVTFKKELPTAPKGFSVKSEQLTNGVYYSYLNPNIWTAPNATAGTMGLDQVFNFGSGTLGNYETTFAASAVGTPNPLDVVVIGDGTLSVASSFVDNTTQHATKVAYNFGKISTETKVNNAVVDYKAVIEEFPTVYSNIYNNTYSWNWATKAQLNIPADDPLPYETFVTYGDGTAGTGTTAPSIDLSHIFGVSSRDGVYSAFLDDPFQSSLVVESAKLVSNANQLDEYFTVTPDPLAGATTFTLTQQSGATNPSADVASTLILNAKDMYGNDVTIKLPFTVKKR